MKEEKMLVLKLLESGKINAEEAEKLLNALKKHSHRREEISENIESKFNRMAAQLNEFSKEVGAKIDNIAKDMEPKIKKSAKIIAESTSTAVDEIAKTFKPEKEEKNNCECGENCCEKEDTDE